MTTTRNEHFLRSRQLAEWRRSADLAATSHHNTLVIHKRDTCLRNAGINDASNIVCDKTKQSLPRLDGIEDFLSEPSAL